MDEAARIDGIDMQHGVRNKKAGKLIA